MRSIKSMMLLAVAVLALTAIAAPALASASNWKRNGEEFSGLVWSQEGSTLESGGTLNLNGRIAIVNSTLGGIDCPASGTGSLNANSGSGQLSSISITASGCKLSGAWKAVCKEVSSVTAGTPWSLSATEKGGKKVISVVMSVSYQMAGGECAGTPPYVVMGEATATPDNGASIGSVTLSGSLPAYFFYGGELHPEGKATLTQPSVLSVEPSGKYGITNQRTVKISGQVGWIDPLLGGATCQVTGTIALEPGSQGKLLSLVKSGTCTSSGLNWSNCGHPTGVSAGVTPWTLTDQGTAIGMAGMSITFDYASCHETSTGELPMSVNKTSAISSSSFEGLLSAGGLKRSWSGSFNWTPAGVYGL